MFSRLCQSRCQLSSQCAPHQLAPRLRKHSRAATQMLQHQSRSRASYPASVACIPAAQTSRAEPPRSTENLAPSRATGQRAYPAVCPCLSAQTAYILVTNASIMRDSGGPCTVNDCEVRTQSGISEVVQGTEKDGAGRREQRLLGRAQQMGRAQVSFVVCTVYAVQHWSARLPVWRCRERL